MDKCNQCPRNCNLSRANSKRGFCGEGNEMVISKVMLHQGEEPFLLSKNDKGSGAIFFSGCSLKCVYCQNFDISHQSRGTSISPARLAQIFKLLEESGAGNIDLVSPTHFTDKIIAALKIYRPQIPIIWNTSGYEKPEIIEKLNGFVDIFLTDFKYISEKLALKYSKAKDYAYFAKAAVLTMKKLRPENIFRGEKLIRGIVCRHLVLPGCTSDSKAVLSLIKQSLGENALLSIMSQYTPCGNVSKFPELNRKITPLEYKIVLNHAKSLGFKNILVQELGSSGGELIPNFKEQIFEI